MIWINLDATANAYVNANFLHLQVLTGAENALWVEVNPTNYKMVYPSAGPPPAASKDGTVVKVAFNHNPAAYTPPNRFMFNTFTDAIAACKGGVVAVQDDHLFASPLLAYGASE